MSRTDKPKFDGTFVGQVCKQNTLKQKKVSYLDKYDQRRYGSVLGKDVKIWVWNGKDWIHEQSFTPGAATVEEWLAKGNKIKTPT